MTGAGGADRAIEPWLLEILACPNCHSALTPGEATLTCTDATGQQCALVYPVRDGIPVLLIDEAARP